VVLSRNIDGISDSALARRNLLLFRLSVDVAMTLCFRSGQMLQSTDFAQSMQRDWRSGEFGCGRCGNSLTGQRYIMHDEQPYCKHCYDTEFANTCASCGSAITTDYKVSKRL
jgi:uncharacterized CHY-type Zn-finger protein